MDDSVGVYLHEVAFQPVISSQGSDEQQAIWVPKCLNHEILGCYLQTELAHGSNVQRECLCDPVLTGLLHIERKLTQSHQRARDDGDVRSGKPRV